MIDKNLISYRRDSDIPREFGDFQTELKMARFKRKQEEWSERMSPDEHLKDIMNQKSPLGEPFVTWLVSNCDHTGGADMRFAFSLNFQFTLTSIRSFGFFSKFLLLIFTTFLLL